MRKEFLEELVALAEADERVMLLTGDLGFMVLEDFQKRFPERFVNCGVAEQNMVGVATGLAEAGFVPFVYSIATFSTLRPYEFIRNGPALHNLPVRIVGVGGGFDYGHNGITHFALEDYAVMRTQPAIATVVPADAAQARAALRATAELPGPVYFRVEQARRRAVPGWTVASSSAASRCCARAATWRSWRSARSPTRRSPPPTCSPRGASTRRSGWCRPSTRARSMGSQSC